MTQIYTAYPRNKIKRRYII